jgi:hypothetical protein
MATMQWSIYVENKLLSKKSSLRIRYFAYYTGHATCNSARLLHYYSVLLLF